MDAQLNYASLNLNQLTNLDGAQGLNVPGARREEGVHATVFRAGDKTVIVTDPNSKDTVDIRYNADGSSTVTVNGEEFELTAQETAALDIHTGDGDDIVTVSGDSEGRGGLTLYTGAGNDHVTGGDGAETVYAGDGNDEVDTGRGNDAVYGGAGNDELRGGHGHDTVHTGTGNDTVRAGSNDNITVGGEVSFVGNVTHGANITVERPDFGATGAPAAANESSATGNGSSTVTYGADGSVTVTTSTTYSAASGSEVTAGRPAPSAASAEATAMPAGGGGGGGGGIDDMIFDSMVESNSRQQNENQAESTGGSARSGRGGGNWLIQLAKALAEIQDKFLATAMAAADTMAANADFAGSTDGGVDAGEGTQGGTTRTGDRSETSTTGDGTTGGAPTEGGSTGSGQDAGKRAAFIQAQAVYQAATQMFTTMANITATSLKSIGEALSSVVRKQ